MKNKFLIFCTFSFIFFGCGMHVPFSYAKHEPVTEPGKGDFVKLKSGEIIPAKKLVWKKTNFILDGNTKFDEKDVIAYQSGDRYQAKVKYGYFCTRILRGKINVYSSSSTGYNDIGKGGTENAHEVTYFVQKGDNPEIVKMTANVLREMTEDNEEAHEMAGKIGKVVYNIGKMEKVVKFYNEN